MSILYEYEVIKQEIGEKKFNQILDFLKYNGQYYFEDVYYKKDVWEEMEEWVKNNQRGE